MRKISLFLVLLSISTFCYAAEFKFIPGAGFLLSPEISDEWDISKDNAIVLGQLMFSPGSKIDLGFEMGYTVPYSYECISRVHVLLVDADADLVAANGS